MTSKAKYLFVAGLVLSAVLLYVIFRDQPPESSLQLPRSPFEVGDTSIAPPSSAGAASQRVGGSPEYVTPSAGVSDYGAEFRRSTNYRSFIQTALPAAEAGDRDAAYFLASAIAYCDETRRFYFERMGRLLSAEQAIEERARHPGISLTEAIRRADGRCREVYEERDASWGAADAWMARAADAGQPQAQARTATDALLALHTGAAQARRLGKPNELLNVDHAREFARAAFESKDPNALFQIADLWGMLNSKGVGNDVSKGETLVMKYAACMRGADCGRDAEWLFQMSTSDPTYRSDINGMEYLQNLALTLEMYDLEKRASDLSRQIDEQPDKAWKDLDLDG